MTYILSCQTLKTQSDWTIRSFLKPSFTSCFITTKNPILLSKIMLSNKTGASTWCSLIDAATNISKVTFGSQVKQKWKCWNSIRQTVLKYFQLTFINTGGLEGLHKHPISCEPFVALSKVFGIYLLEMRLLENNHIKVTSNFSLQVLF